MHYTRTCGRRCAPPADYVLRDFCGDSRWRRMAPLRAPLLTLMPSQLQPPAALAFGCGLVPHSLLPEGPASASSSLGSLGYSVFISLVLSFSTARVAIGYGAPVLSTFDWRDTRRL